MKDLVTKVIVVFLAFGWFVAAEVDINLSDILNAFREDPDFDYTDPSVIVRRMAEEVLKTVPDAVVMSEVSLEPVTSHNISYGWNEHQHKQIGMIVDGKPVVMGAYSTDDPANGVSTMTIYTADKNGYKAKSSYNYSRKKREEHLRKSLLG